MQQGKKKREKAKRWKRSKNVSIPRGHVSVENPKDSAKQLLKLIREFSKVTGVKVDNVIFLSIQTYTPLNWGLGRGLFR